MEGSICDQSNLSASLRKGTTVAVCLMSTGTPSKMPPLKCGIGGMSNLAPVLILPIKLARRPANISDGRSPSSSDISVTFNLESSPMSLANMVKSICDRNLAISASLPSFSLLSWSATSLKISAADSVKPSGVSVGLSRCGAWKHANNTSATVSGPRDSTPSAFRCRTRPSRSRSSARSR